MGMILGLCSASEVASWIDSHIEMTDCPTDWMIELSTSEWKHHLDIVHLLDSVPGVADLEISSRLLIAKLAVVHPSLVAGAGQYVPLQYRELFNSWRSFTWDLTTLSNDVRQGISQIVLDFDCFEQGYGDWQTIQQDYEALLAAGGSYTRWVARIQT
ncbi:MAG: hypothetical protein WBB01_17935 [Phormidesmis sp.]